MSENTITAYVVTAVFCVDMLFKINQVDAAPSSYVVTDLRTISAIQNGHIHVVIIFKKISHLKQNKTLEIMDKLPSCAQNFVSTQDFNAVTEEYRKISAYYNYYPQIYSTNPEVSAPKSSNQLNYLLIRRTTQIAANPSKQSEEGKPRVE